MDNRNWFDDVLDKFVPTCPLSPKQNGGQNKQDENLIDQGDIYSVPSVPTVPTKNDRFVNKITSVPNVPTVPTENDRSNVPTKNDRTDRNDRTDILDFKLEKRRKKVLVMLDEKPDIQSTFITDMDSDLNNVILTIAIRNQYTFEMEISKNKYDAFLMIEILNKVGQGESSDEQENQMQNRLAG